MTTPNNPRTPGLYHATRAVAFSPLEALGVVCAALGLMIVIAGIGISLHLSVPVSIGIGQLAVLLLTAEITRRTRRNRAAIALRRPARIDVAAAILIGCSAWYLNLRLVTLLPLPEEGAANLQAMISQSLLPLTLVTFAVIPALVEEVVFRGVVLHAVQARWSTGAAVVTSAVVFAAYHMTLVQLVPAFTLGVVLAVLAIRARSIIPGMVLHLLNNTAAIVVSRDALPGVGSWMTHHATIALLSFAALFAGGVVVAGRPRCHKTV